MTGLVSGSVLRSGGSGQFITLAGSQPQLPQTPSSSTGYTVVTDAVLVTTYRSSLGNIEFNQGTLRSNIDSNNIRILTNTGSNVLSTSTNTGLLVVEGGVGVQGAMNIQQDIVVNGITFGRGYEGYNNIVIRGTAATPITNFEDGQESIAIGYSTLLNLPSTYKSIAIGRYALSSGTNISNSIGIGDSALKMAGVYQTLFVATITNISMGSTTVVTAPAHKLSTGTAVRLLNIIQPTQLINSNVYYVGNPTTSTFVLYTDIGRTTLLNTTGYTSYSGTGTVNVILYQDQNIAIGVDAASKLINGENNVFIAHAAAQNWSTGSNNIIIGQNTAKYVNTGSGIISIGGDNLVDGVDNQVNIGSVFYYDGTGYSYIASELNVGLGTAAAITSPGPFTSTSTMTGGLVVVGGIASYRNAIIGTTLSILGTDTSVSTTTGALQVAGGVGIAGNIVVKGLTASGSAAPTIASASTIAPVSAITFISGTSTISTITAPSPISLTGGSITLIPTGLWSINTGGNVALASTAVVNKALIMTYDGGTNKWYPSY
jgi:hypothetical protein